MAGTWTCSEDEDFGSLGDNKVIVTGGTSGTPATFADFVTADRAGEAVLLAATAGLSPTLALTYAVRPADVTALLISFIVASKTMETDYIFVTGTDWRGAAQTESLDVTAGNGTYVSTKYFATISNIDCSDNSGGGGTQWADGTVRATQPQWGFVWDYGTGQYQIDCNLAYGNASTATHFRSDNECITYSTGYPKDSSVTSNATLYSGTINNGLGVDGSTWRLSPGANLFFVWFGGTVNFYGARIHQLTGFRLYMGTTANLTDTVINFDTGTNDLFLPAANVTMTRGAIASTDGGAAVEWFGSPVVLSDVATNISQLSAFIASDISASGLTLTNATQTIKQGNAQTFSLIDFAGLSPTTLAIFNAAGVIAQKYTVNIHVSDRAGENLGTVAVLCEDTDGNTTGGFASVNTDASGDIAEQTIIYKQWEGTAETLKDFSPHKFTLSKAGYETRVIDNVTIDSPIVWHLELQTPKAPPRAWRH